MCYKIQFCLQLDFIPLPVYMVAFAELFELAYYCMIGTVTDICVCHILKYHRLDFIYLFKILSLICVHSMIVSTIS